MLYIKHYNTVCKHNAQPYNNNNNNAAADVSWYDNIIVISFAYTCRAIRKIP